MGLCNRCLDYKVVAVKHLFSRIALRLNCSEAFHVPQIVAPNITVG